MRSLHYILSLKKRMQLLMLTKQFAPVIKHTKSSFKFAKGNTTFQLLE